MTALELDGSVVIVGASLAGLRCARGLRSQGFTGRIELVGAEDRLPYDRPPLSKQVLSGAWDLDRTTLLTADDATAEGLTFHLGVPATSLDAEAGVVNLADGRRVQGDRVVIATGASPRLLPGTEDANHVIYLRTAADGRALRQRLATAPASARVVIVGAGFIGAEVATAARALGHDVVVLEALEVPLSPILGRAVGAICGALHARGGVELRTGAQVERIEAPTGVQGSGPSGSVVLAGGERLEADVLVVGVGVLPATGWLEGSGLELDRGLVVDGALFATETVLGIGDVAAFDWHHLGTVTRTRIEHWQVAADHGAFAAKAMLQGRAHTEPISIVPYFWSDQYGVKLQMLGRPLPDDEVVLIDVEPETSKLLALYRRGTSLSAAFTISRPRQLMGFRSLLEQGASFDAALEVARS